MNTPTRKQVEQVISNMERRLGVYTEWPIDVPYYDEFRIILAALRAYEVRSDEPVACVGIPCDEDIPIYAAAQSHVTGMVSVPIEPTEEMIKAGREVFGEHVEDTDADYKRIYAAMIAIAGKEV